MSNVPTRTQVSAGGIVFRQKDSQIEVALIAVAGRGSAQGERRWQLPKGIVGSEEAPEVAALREAQEETGLEATMVGPIDTIEYWYYGSGGKVRFHKYVHFYLLRYTTGHTDNHDHEVIEARWVSIDEAEEMLSFKSEKKVVAQARAMIDKLDG